MIQVTPTISIDESELEFDFIRASGPGGQNVNKVSTAVQLRFTPSQSPSLSERVRARLVVVAGRRMTKSGVLIIEAKRYRTQEKNKADAIARLVALIVEATHRPKPRRKTKPTKASVTRRLDDKKRQSNRKRRRGPVTSDE
jgi:ribosome-associated protein